MFVQVLTVKLGCDETDMPMHNTMTICIIICMTLCLGQKWTGKDNYCSSTDINI